MLQRSSQLPLIRVRLSCKSPEDFEQVVAKRFSGEFFVASERPIGPNGQARVHIPRDQGRPGIEGVATGRPMTVRGRRGYMFRFIHLECGATLLDRTMELSSVEVLGSEDGEDAGTTRRMITPGTEKTVVHDEVPTRVDVPLVTDEDGPTAVRVPIVDDDGPTVRTAEKSARKGPVAKKPTAPPPTPKAKRPARRTPAIIRRKPATSEPQRPQNIADEFEEDTKKSRLPAEVAEALRGTQATLAPVDRTADKAAEPAPEPAPEPAQLSVAAAPERSKSRWKLAFALLAASVATVAVLGGVALYAGLLDGLFASDPTPATADNAAAEVDALLARADRQIESGKLVGPGGDSALDLLLEAKRVSPDHAGVAERLELLANTFEELADNAMKAESLAEAAAHLQAAINASPERKSASAKLAQVEETMRQRQRSAQ